MSQNTAFAIGIVLIAARFLTEIKKKRWRLAIVHSLCMAAAIGLFYLAYNHGLVPSNWHGTAMVAAPLVGISFALELESKRWRVAFMRSLWMVVAIELCMVAVAS